MPSHPQSKMHFRQLSAKTNVCDTHHLVKNYLLSRGVTRSGPLKDLVVWVATRSNGNRSGRYGEVIAVGATERAVQETVEKLDG